MEDNVELSLSIIDSNPATSKPKSRPIQARNEQHSWVPDQITIYLSVKPSLMPCRAVAAAWG